MHDYGFDLYRTNIPPEVIGILPASVARECRAIPVEENVGGLVLAVADPDDTDNWEKLRFIMNQWITVVRATPEAVRFALDKYYPLP